MPDATRCPGAASVTTFGAAGLRGLPASVQTWRPGNGHPWPCACRAGPGAPAGNASTFASGDSCRQTCQQRGRLERLIGSRDMKAVVTSATLGEAGNFWAYGQRIPAALPPYRRVLGGART